METCCVIQARCGSARLPGKVLKPLAGRAVLEHVIARCRSARGVDTVSVATSALSQDDPIATLCQQLNTPVFRGSEDDVLDRYYQAVKASAPDDIVVRVTADCPLVSAEGIAEIVATLQREKLDYCIWDLSRVPLGLASEAMRFAALATAWRDAKEPADREHVTRYLYQDVTHGFRVRKLATQLIPARTDVRLTLDTPEDYAVLRAIFDALYKPERLIALADVFAWLDAHPQLAALNRHVPQKKA